MSDAAKKGWYIYNLEFERKNNRARLLQLDFRNFDNWTTGQVFTNFPVIVPTGFLKIDKIYRVVENLSRFPGYPVRVYLATRHEAESEKLKQLRENLELIVEDKDESNVQIVVPNDVSVVSRLPSIFQRERYDKVAKYETGWIDRKVILDERLEAALAARDSNPELASDLVKQINPKNRVEYYAEKKLHEIVLDYDYSRRRVSGVELGDILTLEETTNQPKVFLDIETPQFGTDEEEISWYQLLYLMPDGSEERELYTKRKLGVREIKGFRVFDEIPSEGILLERVRTSIKAHGAVYTIGHHIPFDIIKTKEAARKNKIGKFDIGVRNKNPGLDISRGPSHMRLKGGGFIDTCRISRVWHPGPVHKLAAFVNKARGMAGEPVERQDFKKEFTHEELREIDKNDPMKMADYSVTDVIEGADALKKGRYLEPMFLVWKILEGHCQIREISDSPNCLVKWSEARHWERKHKLLWPGYEGKKRLDEIEIFKKRDHAIKQHHLNEAKVAVDRNSGTYSEVYKVNMAIELGLKGITLHIEPRWQEFFDGLPENPLQRFGWLRYIAAFNDATFRPDYYFVMNDRFRYDNKKIETGLSEAFLNPLLNTVVGIIGRESIWGYNNLIAYMRNGYRSVYKYSDKEVKALIRSSRLEKSHGQRKFNIVSFFDEDNQGVVKMMRNAEIIRPRLDDKRKAMFDRTINKYKELGEFHKEREDRLSVVGAGILPHNLIYLAAQRERFKYRANKFFDDYGVYPYYSGVGSHELTVKKALETFYGKVGEEIKRKGLRPIMHQDDYLWVVGNPKYDKDSLLIPLQRIENFVIGKRSRPTPGNMPLFNNLDLGDLIIEST